MFRRAVNVLLVIGARVVPQKIRDALAMSDEAIDRILARYEADLSGKIDEALAAASDAEVGERDWHAVKARVASVYEELRAKLEALEHKIGMIEGEDLIEIHFRPRTNPPDRLGRAIFQRKGAIVRITNSGPDGIPVGGGQERFATLTTERILQHVTAALDKTFVA